MHFSNELHKINEINVLFLCEHQVSKPYIKLYLERATLRERWVIITEGGVHTKS
jgi:hypothetical protein